MLYGNIKDDTPHCLDFTCKNCGYNETEDTSISAPIVAKRYDNDSKKSELDDKCIVQTNYFDDIRSFQQYQTKNIKYDMTLPRVNNIDCPKCSSKTNKMPEVICIKYDQANMKFLYFCCDCDHFWRLEE